MSSSLFILCTQDTKEGARLRSTTERHYEILKYLCSRRSTDRQELSYRFGVSLRTIERDLLVLECSYPIYTTQGGGGGIHIMDGFKFGI